MLTNAQIQSRLETLENTFRVIVNQDDSRIQPAGGTQASGYAEGNGRVAASNHVHSVGSTYSGPGPSVVETTYYNGGLNDEDYLWMRLDGPSVDAGNYLLGFIMYENEGDASSLIVSDSQDNPYSMGTVFGTGSTWVMPFSSNIATELTTLVDYMIYTNSPGTSYIQSYIAQLPACGDSGPLTQVTATGTSTSADSGPTATLPQPACFVVGAIFSNSAAEITMITGFDVPPPSNPNEVVVAGAGAVGSTDPVSVTGTLDSSQDWVAVIVPFAIPGGPWSLHFEAAAKVIYALTSKVEQHETRLAELTP